MGKKTISGMTILMTIILILSYISIIWIAINSNIIQSKIFSEVGNVLQENDVEGSSELVLLLNKLSKSMILILITFGVILVSSLIVTIYN